MSAATAAEALAAARAVDAALTALYETMKEIDTRDHRMTVTLRENMAFRELYAHFPQGPANSSLLHQDV